MSCGGEDASVAGGATSGEPSVVQMTSDSHVTDVRWVSSDNLRVTINAYGQARRFLTTGHDDYKPTWSQSGGRLAFFRALQYGSEFAAWKTKLCTIRVDGSGFRELSAGQYADFNPTWTRDGTNLIILNRYAVRGSTSNDIYLVSPDGQIGEETLISNPQNGYEWGFSGLRDGRIFMDRVSWGSGTAVARSFLLTPRPGSTGIYEEITRPTANLWHKLSVSPSETKVAYMHDNDFNMSTYNDVVLYYADFDAATRRVSNPVRITDYDLGHVCEYPRWSADESLIIYDSNRTGVYQMYAYRLADRVTARISSDAGSNSQFGSFEDVPK
jgi:Tol biopolymer transport system component